MKTVGAICILLLVTTLLVSCSDDNPVTPPQFKVTIAVTDTSGNPVTGLDMSLAADLPFYQDKLQSPSKAYVAIPFYSAFPCSARLVVKDIAGDQVRDLLNAPINAGQYQIAWDGKDDDGTRQASGLYVVHFIALDSDSGALLHDEHTSIYMAILDPARLSVGTTDDDGHIVLTDKRLFPQLFDADEIQAVDENAQQIGTIQFTDSMRFQLADLTNGGSHKFYEDISGSKTINVVWNTSPKSHNIPIAKETPHEKQHLILEELFSLGQPYPVPFN